MKTLETRVLDSGVTVSMHKVSTKKNSKATTVEVPLCKSLDDCQRVVDNHLDDWPTIARFYSAHKAVVEQAAARKRLEGGKIPASEYKRIYNAFTKDEYDQIFASDDRLTATNALVELRWRAEQSDED